ncbi:MAG: MarR family winged helix-turn-helix transcriptional regulator [Acidimicrobiales bacterium]
MEVKTLGSRSAPVELAGLFSDLVRLETDLWGLVDQRLRREHDLPLSWFEPMQIMDRVRECRVADIAEALSITVGGASKLVDRIEHAGLCDRTPNPNDARSSVLALSRAGKRLLGAAQVTFDDELAAILGAAIPPERLASFATALRDLRQHITDQPKSAR